MSRGKFEFLRFSTEVHRLVLPPPSKEALCVGPKEPGVALFACIGPGSRRVLRFIGALRASQWENAL